jgi:hypothetical protein
LTFTRASAGFAETSDGRLVEFASGAPRITDRGVLIEVARTNLLTYSQEFDNAAWTKTNTTVTANATTAPDGTTTAEKLVENSATDFHTVRPTTSVGTITATECLSVFAKASERSWLALQMGSSRTAYFNLSAGTIGTTSANTTATMTALANGWYRCSVAGERVANQGNQILLASADNTASYAGDGTSGIFIWGAQLEAASSFSSYIPTVAASAIRAADQAEATLAGVAYPLSMFGAFQLTALVSGASQNVIAVNDASGDLNLLYAVPGTGARTYVENSGATQAFLTITTTFAANTIYKIASRAGADDFRVAFNGTLSSADTSGLAPATPTRVGFGNEFSGSNRLFGYLRNAAIIPGALTNEQLQEITT